MTDMEHAINRADSLALARGIVESAIREALAAVTDGTYHRSEQTDEEVWNAANDALRCLDSEHLLAPAPLREEWGRAYRQADGVLFVDDQNRSFRDRDDVAQLVPPQHPDSPYDLIVKRGVSDWFPAD